jgi:ribosomal protein S19E (S16A)
MINKKTQFYWVFKCSIAEKVNILHLGVLSINQICKRYGSTTSSIVDSSSHNAEERVFKPTGQLLNL